MEDTPSERISKIDQPPVLSGEGFTILLVEDNSDLRSLLLQMLRRSGFRARGARNAVEMREIMSNSHVDLLLLDVMLPGISGFDICREVRARSSLPIILLTALGEATDRVIGLELGADDYMVKPPDPRELVARIRAVLRRRERLVPEEHYAKRDVAVFREWTLDTRQRELTSPDASRIELTGGEYELLLAFVERPQRILSREQLLDLARGRAMGGTERSIDAQISRLRSKLGVRTIAGDDIIKTLRGAGYMLTAPVSWR
ncbi:response regulator [Pseudoroseomonas sp. WGS1072]|uniref:response regulator n=1 Tax=Roseomonas sp. WGS1072 TaxID=3366816 RepID=UPI003BF302B1